MNEEVLSIPKVYDREYQFCLILWAYEPVSSKELVGLCRDQLGWKPTTTYTVIKRLAERGVLQNDNSLVTSLVSKQAVQAYEIQKLVHNRFDGSMSAFVETFKQIQRM